MAVEFSWTAHPAKQRPGRAAMAIAVIIAVGAIVLMMFLTDGWHVAAALSAAVLASVILVLTLHRFFFPSRYEIDAEGITAASMLSRARIEWGRTKRFLHDDNGGYLSSRAVRSRFDAFRGVHLLFGDDEAERARIFDEIQQRVAAARGGSKEPFTTEVAGDTEGNSGPS